MPHSLSIELAGRVHPVTHQVNRRLRNVYIQIRPEGIVLKSPGISRKEAEALLQRQKNWIERKLAEQPDVEALPTEIYFLGRPYRLRIEPSSLPGSIQLDEEEGVCRLFLHPDLCDREDLILQTLDRFYLARARDYFHERLIHWSMRMRLAPRILRFKRLKSRWGSCSSKDAINLNYRAIQLPPECIDAILVHELAHLEHLNHGPRFWKLVKSYVPDYEARDAIIRQLGNKLL